MKVVWIVFLLVHVLAASPPNHGYSFVVQPESVVQAEGLEAVFECLYPGAAAYSWVINETLLSLPTPIGIEITNPTTEAPSRLIFQTTSLYNNSRVQCRVLIEVGRGVFESILSNNVTLQIQGSLTLESVWFNSHRVASDNITISWAPPFSLNLTTAEPDIQYCVDVYVAGGDDHLQSVCDITDTYYTFTAGDPDQLFIFTVTPRSNVEGSLNGTASQPVFGYFCQDRPPISRDMITFSAYVNLSDVRISYELQQNDNLCNVTKSYLELELINEGKSDVYRCFLVPNPKSDSNTRILKFSNVTCDVRRHNLYKVRIHEEYNGGSIKSDWVVISTHDIQNPGAKNQSTPGKLEINNSYLLETKDVGSFFILKPLIPTTEIVYHSRPRESLEKKVSISNLTSSAYQLFSFDIEPTGHPRGLPAALPQDITLLPTESTSSPMPVYDNCNDKHKFSIPYPFREIILSVDRTEKKISMSCSFFADELTGCVGVIHSAQLDNLTLTVLSVERSEGMDFVNVEEVGNYSVAVFGQKGNKLKEFPTLVCIVVLSQNQSKAPATSAMVAIVGILVFLLVPLCFLVMVLMKKSVRTHPKEPPTITNCDGKESKAVLTTEDDCALTAQSHPNESEGAPNTPALPNESGGAPTTPSLPNESGGAPTTPSLPNESGGAPTTPSLPNESGGAPTTPALPNESGGAPTTPSLPNESGGAPTTPSLPNESGVAPTTPSLPNDSGGAPTTSYESGGAPTTPALPNESEGAPNTPCESGGAPTTPALPNEGEGVPSTPSLPNESGGVPTLPEQYL